MDLSKYKPRPKVGDVVREGKTYGYNVTYTMPLKEGHGTWDGSRNTVSTGDWASTQAFVRGLNNKELDAINGRVGKYR